MMKSTDKLVSITIKDKDVDHNSAKHEIEALRIEFHHTGQYECVILDKPAADPVYTAIKNYLKN